MTEMTDDELLQLVRRGVSDSDIGRVLGVSTTQATARVRSALEQHGLTSRAAAVISGVLAHGTADGPA